MAHGTPATCYLEAHSVQSRYQILHSFFSDFPVNGHLFHAAIQFAEPEVGSSHVGIPSLPTALIRGLLGRGSGSFLWEEGNNSNHEP